MCDRIRIAGLCLLVCGSVAYGEAPTVTVNSNVARVLAFPKGYCFPGDGSLNEMHGFLSQSNLLYELCANWDVGKTPETKFSLLKYSLDVYKYRRSCLKGHPRDMQAEEIIGRAFVVALNDDDRGVRSLAARSLRECLSLIHI